MNDINPFEKYMFQSNQELFMDTSDPQEDLKAVLRDASTPRLRLLDAACQTNRLFPRQYVREVGNQGCVMYFSHGITSKTQLIEGRDDLFDSVGTWMAARRVVRYYDTGRLTNADVQQAVTSELSKRQKPAVGSVVPLD